MQTDDIERIARAIYAAQFIEGSDQMDIDEQWKKDSVARATARRQALAALRTQEQSR